MTVYLTENQVINLNKRLILKYSSKEIIGVKDKALLDSSLNRPKQSVFGNDAYKTIYDKATALFHSLIKNHVFHNGNKRTALIVLVVFLQINEIRFNMLQEQAEDFVVDIAKDKYTFEEISKMIREYSN